MSTSVRILCKLVPVGGGVDITGFLSPPPGVEQFLRVFRILFQFAHRQFLLHRGVSEQSVRQVLVPPLFHLRDDPVVVLSSSASFLTFQCLFRFHPLPVSNGETTTKKIVSVDRECRIDRIESY